MKPLFYALLLLAVLVGSVLFLRSLGPSQPTMPAPSGRFEPVVESLPPSPIATRPPKAGRAQEETPDELLDRGQELLGLWHVPEATEALERCVAADSNRYEAWVGLVECYSYPLVCREDAARAAWERASENVPVERDTLYLAGLRDLYLDQDYAAAVDELRSAQRAAPGPGVQYQLARAYYLAGRLDEADAQLEDLLTADDTEGRVLELSIRVMAARGDLDGAESRARDLARVYSEEPFPYVLLAQVEALRGADTTAVEFCNNALSLDARYIPAIVTRAQLYAAARQMEPARVSFEKLLLFDDLILRSIGQDGIAFVDFLSGDFGAGVAAMDEAIRNAIMAGSVRRALSYASNLVAYLCELGQAEEAEGVVDRWITGFGDIPVQLGRLRIEVLGGDLSGARRSLVGMTEDKEWIVWSRVLSLDRIELLALTHVAAGEFDAALSLLSDNGVGVAAGATERRSFLRGYASFENGDAEGAGRWFEDARAHLFGVEFPYHGDPVLAVQSLFFLAESDIASGDEAAARAYYTSFLGYWGKADWELPAVARARERLAGPAGSDESH